MEDLPKTFYDAIIATRHLGYQYLWIDSLCVLQDSKEDWAVEAGKMQDYYSKATLTIVADAAEGDHDGFLHSRPELKTIRVPFRHPSLPSTSYVYIGRRPTDLDGEKTPVRTRAWTLQEDVLSARTLHYTSDQLIFECRKHRRSEADSKAHILNLHVLSKSSFWGPKFIPRGMESGCLRQMLIAKDLSAWYPLLEIYCQRSLTVKDDRIAAISGLAKVVEEESGLFYKAGIFIDDVSQGLLWTLRGRGSRPAKYRAPTWTWTSLDFQLSSFSVRHSFGLYNRLERSAPMPCDMEPSIVECEIKTGHDVQNGRILSGYLRLHGFLLPYSRWQGKSPPYRNTVWSEPKGHLLGTNAGGIENDADAPDQLICDFDVIESAGRTEERILRYTENGRPVEDSDEDGDWDRGILDNLSLFQITRRRVWTSHFDVVFALLLRPAEGHQDGMTFERVGVAEFRHDIPELSRNRWEKKVITVI